MFSTENAMFGTGTGTHGQKASGWGWPTKHESPTIYDWETFDPSHRPLARFRARTMTSTRWAKNSARTRKAGLAFSRIAPTTQPLIIPWTLHIKRVLIISRSPRGFVVFSCRLHGRGEGRSHAADLPLASLHACVDHFKVLSGEPAAPTAAPFQAVCMHDRIVVSAAVGSAVGWSNIRVRVKSLLHWSRVVRVVTWKLWVQNGQQFLTPQSHNVVQQHKTSFGF